MIAAISDNHRTVWGIGGTESEAMQDAHKWMEQKPDVAHGAGTLRTAKLSKGADTIIMDGDELYHYCRAAEHAMQMELL